jgi:2Fe-2S ferredoxin
VAELKKEIHFLPSERRIAFTKEASILEVALKNGIDINHSCGGMGSCTTCRVLIRKSETTLPERNELEQDIAEMRGFRDDERLACQLPPLAGLVVEVPVT